MAKKLERVWLNSGSQQFYGFRNLFTPDTRSKECQHSYISEWIYHDPFIRYAKLAKMGYKNLDDQKFAGYNCSLCFRPSARHRELLLSSFLSCFFSYTQKVNFCQTKTTSYIIKDILTVAREELSQLSFTQPNHVHSTTLVDFCNLIW